MSRGSRREEGQPDLRFAPDEEAALQSLGRDLLRHHRTLMTVAQRDHERVHGRVEGPGQLLHLLMQDPEFAWLRNLSGLIARLDESVETPAPGVAESVVEETAKLLLDADAGDAGFQARYHQALQESPDAVVTHGIVAGTLRKMRGTRFVLHAAP
jgi:hypothetical protein